MLFFTLFSCKEETVVSTVSGQVFQNCNKVAANKEIALKVNSGGSFSEPIILASAVTNSSGYFQMNYELEETETGTADLIQLNAAGYYDLIQNIPLKKDKTYRLYAENTALVKLSLAGLKNWTTFDTLFYQIALDGQEKKMVNPTIGVLDSFYIKVPNLEESGTFTWLSYGVGEFDFKMALKASSIQDSIYQNIGLLLEGCSMKEQVEITIN